MNKVFPKHFKTIAGVFFLSLAVLPVILYHLYAEAIALTLKQFNDHQGVLAEQTAIGIEENLKRLVRELESLSRLPAVKRLDIEEARGEVERSFAYAKTLHVNDVGLLDGEGIARLTLMAPQLTGKDFSFREYFRQARTLTTSTPTYEFITFKGVDAGRKGILIAMPVFPRPGAFGGVVLFTLKVDELIKAFAPTQAEGWDHALWAIDRQGHVLYHPRYRPGSVIDALPDLDRSFADFLGVIRGGEGHRAEYVSPEGVETLAASHPVSIGGQTWSIVVATPKKEVSGLFTHFTGHFTLGIAVAVLAILGGSLTIIFLFNKWNQTLQREIAERIQAEEELRISEERFRALFNQASDSIFLMAFDATAGPVIVDANIAACQMHGYKKEELLGKPIGLLDAPDTAEHVAERAKRLWAGESLTFEGTHVRKDRTVFPVEVSAQTIRLGKTSYILAIDRDITARKAAEDQLRQSRQMLLLVLDTIPQYVFWKNRNSVYLGCNQNFARAAGIENPKDIFGKTDYDLPWKRAESDFYRECDRRVMETDTAEYHIIERQLQASGKETWLDTNKVPLHDGEGNVVGILGTYEDISERLLAEKELKKAHDKLELRVEERTADLQSANELLQLEIQERERAEGVLRTIAEGVSGATGDAFFLSLVQTLAKTLEMDYALIGRFTGEPHSGVQTMAMCSHGDIVANFHYDLAGTPCAKVTSQGMCLYPSSVRQHFPDAPLLRELQIESYLGTLLFDSLGRPLGLMSVMDSSPITNPETATSMLQIFAARAAAELERKRHEEELLKARNLESIGRLAAGIAHEINNPLTNASLNIQVLEKKLKGTAKESALLHRLEAVERNIDRASTIAKELLLFSRQKETGLIPVNINDVIGGSLTLLTYDLSDITVEQSLADVPDVLGDPLKLESLFINILNNAIEAMPAGGTLSISTDYRDDRVVTRVADSGVGIPEAYLTTVFDPFFTTKEVGEGTGLGLSICYGIVQQHDGTIELSSEVNKGTEVTITLPAMQ